MTLYITNNSFNKELYIECLNDMGVDAKKADQGVLINMEQYKENYKASEAPYMVYMNHKFVKQLY